MWWLPWVTIFRSYDQCLGMIGKSKFIIFRHCIPCFRKCKNSTAWLGITYLYHSRLRLLSPTTNCAFIIFSYDVLILYSAVFHSLIFHGRPRWLFPSIWRSIKYQIEVTNNGFSFLIHLYFYPVSDQATTERNLSQSSTRRDFQVPYMHCPFFLFSSLVAYAW